MNTTLDGAHRSERSGSHKAPHLTPELIRRIEAMLRTVGDYGEIHLIVQRGELRYINAVQSHKVTEPLD